MALKIHMKLNYDGDQGITLCGEPFVRTVNHDHHNCVYASTRRIGAIRAVHETEFEPNKEHCLKCINAWADGKDLE
jgi:hypothetical protein